MDLMVKEPSKESLLRAKELVVIDPQDKNMVIILGKSLDYHNKKDAEIGREEFRLLLAQAMDEFADERQIRNSWDVISVKGQC
jgi:hypothetical protein